jgi:hypothetical protein
MIVSTDEMNPCGDINKTQSLQEEKRFRKKEKVCRRVGEKKKNIKKKKRKSQNKKRKQVR